jgi:hypothetical protein
MSFKIFLDDYRDPSNAMPYMLEKMGKDVLIYTEGWVVVRSYHEFRMAVLTLRGLGISHVSFDYDLLMTDGKKKTGEDCAWLLKNLCNKLPKILIHSTNDTGIKKIQKVFK